MSILSRIRSKLFSKELQKTWKGVRYVCSHYPDNCNKFFIVSGYLSAKRKYGIKSSEFCYLHWLDLSDEVRSQMVPFSEQWGSLYGLVNDKDAAATLCDKYATFLLFKDYFKREVVLIDELSMNEEKRKAEFESFLARHNNIIIKPLSSNKGNGIRIINTEDIQKMSISNLLKQYPKGFVAEELVQQSEEMAKFHPESVNTLRINTMRYDDEVEILWPVIRMGRGNNVVDNAGSGGVFSSIDPSTGITFAAKDEMGRSYSVHPDSELPIVGIRIPHWEEACMLVKELAMILPQNRYTGWDLALTDSGWVMIEANCGPLNLHQITTQQGDRADYYRIRERVGLVR